MILLNIIDLWNSSWPAGVTILGLSFFFAVVLLIASIKLKVEVDPKVQQVRAALPGIDCGVCGFAGCNDYAKAIVANPEIIGKCAPGGADCAAKIAAALNLQISAGGHAKRPIVHCRSHIADRAFYAKYDGIPSCTAANAVANVQMCKWGCMGFGDCVRACKFKALSIVDGLSTVNYEKCTGCSACAKACPRNLIEMVPFSQENMMTVACRSKENGKTTRSACKVGCIGCGICAKQNSELFTIDNNLARMDYVKYQPSEKTQAAMDKCPAGVIVYRGKTAPLPRPTKE